MQDESPTQAPDISVRDYMDLLRRRKPILIQTFLVVFLFGVAVTLLTKPLYRTGARIMVEGKALTLTQVEGNDPLSDIFSGNSSHDVSTQIEVLQGEQVLADAYKEANVPPGSVHLDVKQVGGTDVIELNFESNRPVDAEALAHAMPSTYRRYVSGNRKTEITRAHDFAIDRLRTETAKLHQSELALEKFKERTHLVDLKTERDKHLADSLTYQTDVRKASGTVQGLQARLDTLLKARAAEPEFVNRPTSTTNAQIQTVQDQIATLQIERKKQTLLINPNGSKAVPIQQIDLHIHELQQQLAALPATVTTDNRLPNPLLATYDEQIGRVRAELAEAQVLLTDARTQGPNAAGNLSRYGMWERQQAELQRDIDRHQATVAMLTKDVEDLGLRLAATHDPVVEIQRAGTATKIAPKTTTNLVFALVLGLLLGLCFALLQEFLDDRVNTPEQARRALDTPILGYVPLIENSETRLLTTGRNGGSVLESYRVLRSNVQFASVDAPVRSILVTSTAPGEGKSLTAANLAIALALDERRVILVDADLRRPTLHEKFSLQPRPGMGLTNVLVGHVGAEEALMETAIPGLRLLTAGPLPPNPAELLHSRAMHQLHATLKELADVVIFDSPPCLATADAQVLASEVEGVLYVMQFGQAKKSAVQHAGALLNQAHARLLGIVCNKIDLTAQRDDYYYGYSQYYSHYTSAAIDGVLANDEDAPRPEAEKLLAQRDRRTPRADKLDKLEKTDRKK